MKEKYDAFASRLESALNEIGIKKQVVVAEELGVSKGYLSQLFHGKKMPSDLLFSLIETKLGINSDWLKTGKGEMLLNPPAETNEAFKGRLLLLIEDHTNGNKKKFANLIEVSPQNIDSWINRGYFPKQEHLKNLREKLGVNINWLLTGKGSTYTEDREAVLDDLVEKGAEVETVRERRKYSIGGRIAMAREKGGYSQEDFASEVRIDPASLNRYEKGRAIPDAMLLSTMLVYLNCDAEWLLTGMAPEGTQKGEVPLRFQKKPTVHEGPDRRTASPDEMEKARKEGKLDIYEMIYNLMRCDDDETEMVKTTINSIFRSRGEEYIRFIPDQRKKNTG